MTENRKSAPVATAPVVKPVADAGFSLIELMIAASITATVAALAVPAHNGALYRARVTRAAGDLNGLGKEIVMYKVAYGCFLASLVAIARDSARDPWGRSYRYAVPSAPAGGGRGSGGGSCQACVGGCVSPGAARKDKNKDKNLVPINADFDLYSVGQDGATAAPITAKQSLDDIIRGRSGSFFGLASEY